MDAKERLFQQLSRRDLLRVAGVGALTVAFGGIMLAEGCKALGGSSQTASPAASLRSLPAGRDRVYVSWPQRGGECGRLVADGGAHCLGIRR